MSLTLTVVDQTTTGTPTNSIELPDIASRTSLRELIRLRVREEVARHNASEQLVFSGLIQPTDTEATLNGYRFRTRRTIDWERQADVAVEAFETNGFFVLVDDEQVTDLDAELDLSAETEIAFVRLVPLVGG